VSDGASDLSSAGLLRRFAAIVYDAILLAGVLVLASAVVTIPLGLALGPDKAQPLFDSPWFRWPFFVYCVVVAAAFHLWFWTHGGQTLGMRAWRLKVVREDGGTLTPRDSLFRWAAALLSWAPVGLGFLWSLLDPRGLTWHDRISRTHLVLLARPRREPDASLSECGAAAPSPQEERPPPAVQPPPRG
jgi:uncharacterized RDD family membrane protein YckC